jgi:hypothetical protein
MLNLKLLQKQIHCLSFKLNYERRAHCNTFLSPKLYSKNERTANDGGRIKEEKEQESKTFDDMT